jgi:hypothetical protein
MVAPPNLCNSAMTLPSSDALSQDSVDGARTGVNICDFRNYHNAEARYGRLLTPRIAGAEHFDDIRFGSKDEQLTLSIVCLPVGAEQTFVSADHRGGLRFFA